jgi:hypothetical protein
MSGLNYAPYSNPCTGVSLDSYVSSYYPTVTVPIPWPEMTGSWESLHYDSAGEELQLAWSFNPSGGSSAVTFSSSDESIATVNAEGLVIKMKAYSWTESDPVIITVTTTDGGFTDAVTIDQAYPT